MPTKFDSALWCNYIFAFRKIDQNHIIKIINLGINHNIVMEILIAQYNNGKKNCTCRVLIYGEIVISNYQKKQAFTKFGT